MAFNLIEWIMIQLNLISYKYMIFFYVQFYSHLKFDIKSNLKLMQRHHEPCIKKKFQAFEAQEQNFDQCKK